MFMALPMAMMSQQTVNLANNAAALGGKAPSYYHDWDNLTSVPASFTPAALDHDSAYLGLTAKAADSQLLDGMSRGDFAHSGPYGHPAGVAHGAYSVWLEHTSGGGEYRLVFDEVDPRTGYRTLNADDNSGLTFNPITNTLTVSGYIHWSSDERLKTHVATLLDALATVNRLRGVNFVKDDKKAWVSLRRSWRKPCRNLC